MEYSYYFGLVVLVQNLVFHRQIQSSSQDYCFWESFQPSCAEDEVLVIDQALYGLMSSGRCVDDGYTSYIGCSADLLGYLDKECSGFRECELDVHSKEMKDSIQGTCPEPYLEVSYKCQKVITWKTKCSSSMIPIPSQPGTSYIASLVTQETTCGHGNSPLVISGEPGQILNLTLWDFDWSSRSPFQHGDECVVLYGHIFDAGKDDVTNICGGGVRLKHLYTSASHQVQLVLKQDIVDEYQFLIHFDVLGCPDPKPPLNSWTRKNGNILTIGCHGSSESWQLKCVRGHWVGLPGNCTQAIVQPTKVEIKQEHEFNGNHVLAFGVGCAAIAICCITVTLGVFCIKRYKVRLEGKYSKAAASEMYMVPTNTSNWQNVTTSSRSQPQHTAAGTILRQSDKPLRNDQSSAMYANVTIPGTLHNRETLLIDRNCMGTLLPRDSTPPRVGTLDRQFESEDNSAKYFVLEKPPGYNQN